MRVISLHNCDTKYLKFENMNIWAFNLSALIILANELFDILNWQISHDNIVCLRMIIENIDLIYF